MSYESSEVANSKNHFYLCVFSSVFSVSLW